MIFWQFGTKSRFVNHKFIKSKCSLYYGSTMTMMMMTRLAPPMNLNNDVLQWPVARIHQCPWWFIWAILSSCTIVLVIYDSTAVYTRETHEDWLRFQPGTQLWKPTTSPAPTTTTPLKNSAWLPPFLLFSTSGLFTVIVLADSPLTQGQSQQNNNQKCLSP